MKQFIQSLFTITQWITNLVYINLLWLLFTLLGGIIFGIIPSTVVLYSLTKNWIQGHHMTPLFKNFWNLYKTEWVNSNKLIFFLAPIGLILWMNLLFITNQPTFQYTHIPLWAMVILSALTSLYIVPAYNYFETGYLDILKNSFLTMLISPVQNFYMVISLGSLLVIYYFFPSVAFFFNASVFAWINNFFTLDAFNQVMKKKS